MFLFAMASKSRCACPMCVDLQSRDRERERNGRKNAVASCGRLWDQLKARGTRLQCNRSSCEAFSGCNLKNQEHRRCTHGVHARLWYRYLPFKKFGYTSLKLEFWECKPGESHSEQPVTETRKTASSELNPSHTAVFPGSNFSRSQHTSLWVFKSDVSRQIVLGFLSKWKTASCSPETLWPKQYCNLQIFSA